MSPIDQRAARGYSIPRRTDGARLFRRALRHSRRVRFIRLAIPFGLVGAIAISVVIARLDPIRMLTGVPVDFSNLVVSGTKITMQAPRIAGFTNDSRPYELTAQAAAQDVTDPDTIELHGLHGKSLMTDQSEYELTADAGTFANKNGILTLRQNVVLKSSNFEVYLSEATVEVQTSRVVSEKPVKVQMTQAVINANRMEVTDQGDTIRFGGGVTMITAGSGIMHLNGNMGMP